VSAPLAAALAAGVLAITAVIEVSLPSAPQAPLPVEDARVQRQAGLWRVAGAPYTGHLVEPLPEGGRIERSVRDGRRHGQERSYYADGTLRSLRVYTHGVKVGVHRGWWPNGQRQFERRFSDGRSEGVSRSWYASGQMLEEHRYAGGQEAGPQRLWFEDGRSRASYDVRGGRRYGTIGSKPCLSAPHAATVATPS